MDQQHKSTLFARPRRTAIGVALIFVGIIVAGLIGFTLLFNSIQSARRGAAEDAAEQRGDVVNKAEYDRRYPTIDFF